MELSKEIIEKAFEAIEVAKTTGKIKKGINEVTKVIEKNLAKLVVVAKDVNPPEIIMHIKPLCDEKGVICIEVSSREELGTAAGLQRPTSTVAIVQEGDSKKLLKEITDKLKPKEKAKRQAKENSEETTEAEESSDEETQEE
ncbi:MAG: ribosomal L7Ae/L30e/S12e/Gadd45 family protein [Candidatus Nanoarchaeia archaeon]|nr:ribosomal L7Ae/L30e/S12e/Gadd45 family protein [Candidatus Nanoarchaeia archaeon]